jgi:hypothetical protein
MNSRWMYQHCYQSLQLADNVFLFFRTSIYTLHNSSTSTQCSSSEKNIVPLHTSKDQHAAWCCHKAGSRTSKGRNTERFRRGNHAERSAPRFHMRCTLWMNPRDRTEWRTVKDHLLQIGPNHSCSPAKENRILVCVVENNLDVMQSSSRCRTSGCNSTVWIMSFAMNWIEPVKMNILRITTSRWTYSGLSVPNTIYFFSAIETKADLTFLFQRERWAHSISNRKATTSISTAK